MSKKYFNSYRNVKELYETDLIRDYFAEYRERNVMLITIQTFNGNLIPCIIKREDYRQNIVNFPIINLLTKNVIPDGVFIRFMIQNKDNKVVDIPFIEEPKIYVKGKTKQYILSEFLTTEETLNKEYYDTHIIHDKVCLLFNITYENGIYVYHYVDVNSNSGYVISYNSSQININNFTKTLLKKTGVKSFKNTQQYVMLLCNSLLELTRMDINFLPNINERFLDIIARTNVDYNTYKDYLTNLLKA